MEKNVVNIQKHMLVTKSNQDMGAIKLNVPHNIDNL